MTPPIPTIRLAGTVALLDGAVVLKTPETFYELRLTRAPDPLLNALVGYDVEVDGVLDGAAQGVFLVSSWTARAD